MPITHRAEKKFLSFNSFNFLTSVTRGSYSFKDKKGRTLPPGPASRLVLRP
jgi:hypothetical protein